ncbi:MAG: DNA repair protein RecN [Coriobacteriia bacterium]|nr:DNA repair protein RecN [Coriobacteriia bacterium]
MLEELHIRNVALIEEAWIEPGPKLTVLTGETGAGKTVLLSALKLIMGERADTALIRTGADAAQIEAQWAGETVATRTLNVSGRNRCTLNGELVNVGTLADTLGPTVDLHGQHDHQALLRPATHATLLDAWGGAQLAEKAAAYRSAFAAYREAVKAQEHLQAHLTKSAEEVELGRIALAEIKRIDPQPNEDDELAAILPALQNAEAFSEALGEAVEALRGGESRGDGGAQGASGAVDRLAHACNVLSAVTEHDARLAEVAKIIEQAMLDLEDAGATLRDYAAHVEHNEDKLEETLTRLGALDGLKKRFGPSLDAVLERRSELEAALTVTEDSDGALARAEAEVVATHDTLKAAATAFHDARVEVARTFVKELRAGVISLDMEHATFEVQCTLRDIEQFSAESPDTVEFLYRPAPNAQLRPLAKIASGGEISRVMLALKGVLGAADLAQTLVFDEIDAGIGGATATAIGRRLAMLAGDKQVIVVTHLAQVAAFADTHYVVRKTERSNRAADDTTTEVATTVERVEGDAREAEIARMLSGETSQAARTHARELLVEAQTR